MLDDRKRPSTGPGPRWARVVTRGLHRRTPPAGTLAAAVAAHTVGDGPDVVVVPGLAVSAYLRGMQTLLARSARVHLLDLPGTGAAPDVPGAPTLREDAAAVAGWMRTHLRAPAVVVGHSYGTQVAARAAATGSVQLRGVVLASPTIDPGVRSALRLFARWRRDQATQPAGLASVNRPQQRRAGLARIVAKVVSMLSDDIGRWLVQVDPPVTVLLGTRDAYASRAWACRLGDRFVPVPDGTHTFPFDHPDAVVTAVQDLCGEDENR